MLVTDLQQMESIVESRNDLSWEGWDVVKHTKSPKSIYSVDGVFRDGEWYKKKLFPITEKGWSIPNSIGQRNGKLER